MMSEVDKEINSKKDELFKETQELFTNREKQANLIGQISGCLSASRNLQANINNLKQKSQRQQELLYNAEFQIQTMERRLSQAMGDISQDKAEKLKKDIDEQKGILKGKEKDYNMLSKSNKELQDELRNIDRKISKAAQEMATLESTIQELELENEMSVTDLEKIKKKKQDTMVQHDCNKLEIKKLREKVNSEADAVFGFENRKYQLEMSMEEREKEVSVHKDILVSELKSAEEERHKVAVELQERKNKVNNLKIKYEVLVQRNNSSSDDVENVGEHSQAYYVIKAAQEREELQRYGDELDGKIRKAHKELQALMNTLKHLQGRNQNYRDKFLKGAEGADLEKKQILEEQC